MSDAVIINTTDRPLLPMPWARICIYALAWLPQLTLMVYIIPQFGPLFERLDEKGGLPGLSRWVWGSVYFNLEWSYLPLVLSLMILLAAAEFIIAEGRETNLAWRACWLAAVASIAIFIWFIFLGALMLPRVSQPP
jgi:hypothetical protein